MVIVLPVFSPAWWYAIKIPLRAMMIYCELLSGCSTASVTNVCGDETCTSGPFGFTCGERLERDC